MSYPSAAITREIIFFLNSSQQKNNSDMSSFISFKTVKRASLFFFMHSYVLSFWLN